MSQTSTHQPLSAIHVDERPTTGERPVYDGRFNMNARRPISEENIER